MKKRTALLLALILVFALAACGGNPEANAVETTLPPETGHVFYLNHKPEAHQAWQALAQAYTAQTGVEVEIQTAGPETYEAALEENLNRVTLFNCAAAPDMQRWSAYALDLSGTPLAGELTAEDWNLYGPGGELTALGFCYDSYGILVNLDLLSAAGYALSDITGFASLKAIAEDIHLRTQVLGFDAFACANLNRDSLRFSGHLASVPLYYEFRDRGVTQTPAAITGTYLDNLRNIWDLYLSGCSVDPKVLPYYLDRDSLAQFTAGAAVFYQGGTWEYPALLEGGMDAERLAMIPIYCGVAGEEQAGLCSGTDSRWVVNARAGEANIQATLDFLYWVVTSGEGTQMLADCFGNTPFRQAVIPENPLCAYARDLAAAGRYSCSWAFQLTPNGESWRDTVVTALSAYSADPTDATWTAVVDTFVDGWAYEYTMVKE